MLRRRPPWDAARVTRARLATAALAAARPSRCRPTAVAAATRAGAPALNAERAANGLPAGVAEAPDGPPAAPSTTTTGPRTAARRRPRRGGRARPGHPEGDLAGHSAVLAGTSWSRGNPFAAAPSTWCGSWTRGSSAPVWTTVTASLHTDHRRHRSGRRRRRGLHGSRRRAHRRPAPESPGVAVRPGDLLGLAGGHRTGPHLLVLAHGPFARDDATHLLDVTPHRTARAGRGVLDDDADPRSPVHAAGRHRRARGARSSPAWSTGPAPPCSAPAASASPARGRSAPPAPRRGSAAPAAPVRGLTGRADVTVRDPRPPRRPHLAAGAAGRPPA